MNIFKQYLYYLYKNTERKGEKAIETALAKCKKGGVILDLGCWNGEKTLQWANTLKAKKVIGIEKVSEAADKAKKLGIEVYKADLNRRWPIKSNSIDCVVSNIVIEHMTNVDNFISESYRVLKGGRHSVVSTNNLASWHNIGSLLFGWAPFDLTNSSTKIWGMGNPLAFYKGEPPKLDSTYSHKCIYTAKWLKVWYGLYNFKLVKAYGSGYYPLPSFFGKIDKTHAALITLLFKK